MNSKMEKKGVVIRVAKYYPGKNPNHYIKMPSYLKVIIDGDGFGSSLKPDNLVTKEGVKLPNFFEFNKVHKMVKARKIRKSDKYPNAKVIWEHPEEELCDLVESIEISKDDDGNEVKKTIKKYVPNEKFYAWNKKGLKCEYNIYFPNGYEWKHNYQYHLIDGKEVGYSEARKHVFCKMYAELVKETSEFQYLKDLVEKGQNILIMDSKGPDPTYGNNGPYRSLNPGFPAMKLTEDTVKFCVKDTHRVLSPGVVLGALLLGKDEWIA